MPFQKGNQIRKGKPNPGTGRPKKKDVEIRKAANEIAKEYIEASIKPVLHTYFQLAHGRLVNKWHEGKVAGQDFEADAPTTRHFIDKVLPNGLDGQTQNRPIAIQIVVESGDNSTTEGARDGRTILIGDE